MNAMMMSMNMSAMISEDVNAPELRNPKAGAARAESLIKKLARMLRTK